MVYFSSFSESDACRTGCTWSPTAGLHVAPVGTPARWPVRRRTVVDENTLILDCYDALAFRYTDRLRYDLLTGEITNDELGDGGQLDGLYLHSMSPNGRYQLFINDILAVPLAKVKDTTTGTITQVGVSGACVQRDAVPQLVEVSSVGAIHFVNWYGVTDEGEVVYDKDVWHRTLRSLADQVVRHRDAHRLHPARLRRREPVELERGIVDGRLRRLERDRTQQLRRRSTARPVLRAVEQERPVQALRPLQTSCG